MLPSERLKGIEAFVAAAELGSFTAAAERLNLTTSAISKSVARLESRLDCKLFERTTRRLALTDEGSAFYATCSNVLKELADAEAVLAAHGSVPIGRLRVDLPVAFGRSRVMPLLLRYAEQHPAVTPRVSFTDRFVDVLEDGIDVAVRIGIVQSWPDGLARRHLGTERLIFCASPSYLKRRGVPRDIHSLMKLDRVLYGRADGGTSPWRFAEGANVELRDAPERLVLGSAEAQVEAVKSGFGVAQLATWLIRRELDSGELVEMLPDQATEGLPLHLVWPTSRQLIPKVDALLSLLTRELRID
ncbi:LysR family transcriptional regulator [Paraburkholderia sp. J94]|uniref:LysR family transcriptional regulator n=1 Tax=Paraburkholderia sp. J94 TaxID=2805441 RepID=UPI002AAFCCA1|nr:LysR family transcriptional regulator [Paraburkholderia sp. J94]